MSATQVERVPQAPLPNSYHVRDGLFAGEYPFKADAAAGGRKLERLLAAGIGAFVDLTERDEGLTPYEAVLGQLAPATGLPSRYFRFGITDNSVPKSPELMRRILDTIDAEIGAGRRVYVHCLGGVGRTGVVVGCWLVRHGATGPRALERVAELFATMTPEKVARHRYWDSPQTEPQREYVRNWTESSKSGGANVAIGRLLLPDGAALDELDTDSGDVSDVVLALRDRIRGALVGLATGDALGTTLEFRAPGTFEPVTDMVGGGPFRLEPGQWTDDTSMALCLAESLIERRDFDLKDQLKRYVRWYRRGHLSSTGKFFDIGTTTRRALERFEQTKDEVGWDPDPRNAPNGSLMRLAAVPMMYWQSSEAVSHAVGSSITTHDGVIAVDACRYLAALIAGAIRGASREELLAPFYTPFPGLWEEQPLAPEIAEVAAGSFRRKNTPQIHGTTYCVDALEAALWAFDSSSDFRSGALLAVNLGDDADTTGAIYGQMAGAYYGEAGIPSEWRSRLALKAVIDRYAETLFQLSLRHLPRLGKERGDQVAELVTDALTRYGTAAEALAEINGLRARELADIGALAYHMGGSMGAEMARQEALLQLRVRAGLDLGA